MWTSRVFYYLALSHLVASQLQPVVQSDKKSQYILQALALTERLEVRSNFIFFLGDCRSSTCEMLPRQTADRFAVPVTIIGNELVSLEEFIIRSSVIVIIFSDFNDRIKQIIEEDSNAKPYNSFIFVHDSRTDLPLDTSKRIELFDWCNAKHMLKMILIETYQQERYRSWAPLAFSKFRKMKLITDWELKHLDSEIFLKIYKQHKFHILVSVYDSLPIVYVYNTTSRGKVQRGLGGENGIMITEFVRYIQGSMEFFYFTNQSDMKSNIKRIAGNRLVDIGVNIVANNSLLNFTPVVLQSRLCLLVPFARPMALDKYYDHCVKKSLYLFWLFAVLMNVLIKRLSNRNMTWSELCYRHFNLLFGLCPMGREFRNMRLAGKIIESFTQLYLVIIVSLICSALTASFTLGYYEPEIKDAQTLLDSELRIMVSNQEHLRAFERNELPRELLPRVLLVDHGVRQRHLLSLNVSYAYVLESFKWEHFAGVQQRLRKPKLILAPDQLCTVYRSLVFDVRPELPYAYMFYRFITASQESGLNNKWMRMGLHHAQELGLISPAPYEPIQAVGLPLEFFKTTFFMYTLCILVSLVVFVLEQMHMLWLRRRQQQQAHELVYLE